MTQEESPVGVAALTFFLRHRRWFTVPFLVVSVLVVVVGYPYRFTYTSVASFVTEAQRGGAVGNLAAQLGVAVAANQSSFTSPLFYPELLKSQQFMSSVVDAKVPVGNGADSSTLVDVWGVRSEDPRMSRELASRILDLSMGTTVAPQTGIVKIAVTTESPQLSLAIAQTVLQKVQEFNIRARQGRAAAERKFVEQRLAEVKADLRGAQDRLQTFLSENRDYSKSPSLQFQQARLNQEVMLQQQLTSGMAQAYEQAKIDEVRDTPVVTILSLPDLPVLPNPRGRIRLGVMALFFGFGAGMLALYLFSQLGPQISSAESPRAELSRYLAETRADAMGLRVRQALFGRRG